MIGSLGVVTAAATSKTVCLATYSPFDWVDAFLLTMMVLALCLASRGLWRNR